ncbi:hypothetical protein [uncultured Clostridium sp.]|uniref:hypothetical protein n=1 Tax=uncultured Clostridium sp. TaxID=59620 RepID=UPI003216AA54
MSGENIFEILERNNLGTGLDYSLYEEFSKTTKEEKDIVDKIVEYNTYRENSNNKYSEEIMKYLRQREGLNKYDFSNDDEINKMSPNEAFDNVVKWNGLLGGYSNTIKSWVKEIYGVDLDEIK